MLSSMLSLGVKADDPQFQAMRSNGCRNGKHSGYNPGAFGGPSRAKNHRKHYLAGSA